MNLVVLKDAAKVQDDSLILKAVTSDVLKKDWLKIRWEYFHVYWSELPTPNPSYYLRWCVNQSDMPSSVRTLELFDSVTMLRAHGKRLGIISYLCSGTVPLPRKLSLCRLFQLFFLHPFRLCNSFLTLSDFKPVSFSTCECASWNYPHLRLFTHLKNS